MTTCPTCYQVVNTERSGQDHNRFWGVLQKYVDHWNEDYIDSNGEHFKPENSEHLKAFLACEAGFKHCKTLTLPNCVSGAQALAEFEVFARELLGVKKGYTFEQWHGRTLVVSVPQSIQYTNKSRDRMARTKWNKFREAAEEILYGVHNMPVKDFLKEHGRAA